jgi:hypothetical protein
VLFALFYSTQPVFNNVRGATLQDSCHSFVVREGDRGTIAAFHLRHKHTYSNELG